MFVSDSGYMYVSTKNSVQRFPKALNMFTKEALVPVPILADSHKCDTSMEAILFFQKTRTTLGISKVQLNGQIGLSSTVDHSRKLSGMTCLRRTFL
jgi:hypothetical protein